MELGAHVWLRRKDSDWGWVPAVIHKKEPVKMQNNVELIKITLKDDPNIEMTMPSQMSPKRKKFSRSGSQYFSNEEPFEVGLIVDPEQLKSADHSDMKLRNLPNSFQLSGEDPEAGLISSPSTKIDSTVVGGVDDLIELTHLHEPAILHALRLRYDAGIIYTATGPILIAVNPFKAMPIYSNEIMEHYRHAGENGAGRGSNDVSFNTPFKKARRRKDEKQGRRLPPHVYQAADDAYRAMSRGLENKALMRNPKMMNHGNAIGSLSHTNQSILVSGESGAGKTVTTKIALNYFAMLSKKIAGIDQQNSPRKSMERGSKEKEDVGIEQQVLQSNPILESFGNARTIRNDNSSRFGKYIDIKFTRHGRLSGASIETYLLEKVRLIHPSIGERNYHIFYQFLKGATKQERNNFHLNNLEAEDFCLLSESGTFDRRDGESDVENHQDMLKAMKTIGFPKEMISDLMRLVASILFAGNMIFKARSRDGDSCFIEKNDAAINCAYLLGITFDGLSTALTQRTILAGDEVVRKALTVEQATKASEAMIKAVYGAMFEFVVEKVNTSIVEENVGSGVASIGVLDIFGFESFKINSFEQICINYTNEALQQQFNKYVFKLEQQEYEKEGILWKFISFPDNQDVLDLIDKKHTGILALLDEQCILPKSTDEKFTRYLYARCDKLSRFNATSSQRVDYLFSIEHYAGFVEYTTDGWLVKNKDQLPSAASELLKSSNFKLIEQIQKFVRSEERAGRGTVATKSVSSQFSTQLRVLRSRIDKTIPHYIRCLKPNDELVPEFFEPKNVVEQLRCGGVLEAVRVSRAGYPTRYPHDVFMARYHVLREKNDESSSFSLSSQNEKEAILKRLISKISFDLWQADHNNMQAAMEAEKMRRDRGGIQRYGNLFTPPGVKSRMNTGPAVLNAPPFSLVVESSVMTPEDQKRKRSEALNSRKRETHNVKRPETENEFLKLDFSSRCAVAGLQLGRTKVFLRREAFDRIEAMRSDKFCSAATTIQKVVRSKLCREYYKHVLRAVIKIQSVVRMNISSYALKVMNMGIIINKAATVIQCSWRRYIERLIYYEVAQARRTAAIMIQRTFRDYKTANDMYPTEDDIIRAVISLQSMFRGYVVRSEKKTRAESLQLMSRDSREIELIDAVVPDDRQLATVDTKEITSVDQYSLYELFREIQQENWAMVESLLDKHPELAEAADSKTGELALHKISRHSGAWTLLIDMILVLYPEALDFRDNMGALPMHHAAAHDNVAALEIIYSAYKKGINDADKMGRLPIHVAANYDAADAVKFLLSKSPEGAYTMIYRPANDSGGGLPLHIACSNNASIGVITALLAENFASAKRADENGDLPLHLLLRCGEIVDPVVVKTLLTCFSGAVSRTDMHGDLPLAIAIKYQCRSAVVNAILMQYPEAAGVPNGAGHSPLFLAFKHNADDRTIMGLLNHAPDLATTVDRKSGLLPIQVATENEHSHFIVHNLLKRDMPIDTREKVRAQLIPHHYSWNHIVSNTNDLYHQVVTKVLQSCTQPQVLALAHVEGPDGTIALAAATPVCKHEMRVMLRLFNTLEVVNQRPAYTNPVSDTQIFYALRYDPPAQRSGAYTVLHEDKNNKDNDYVEDWDDASQVSAVSKNSIRSTLSNRSQHTIEDRLRQIRREKGQQVIAKLTSRSDIVERELKIRKDYHLSRHYVPAVISVHHTVQHAAYSEAMAEPGYCITMEGADTTAENLMLDMRKNGKQFPTKALKRIGISLLHMHEHGVIHGDFGTHNIGKFGSRWKLLGVGGSVPIGHPTDPNRGFYHPPESIVIENKRVAIGKKSLACTIISISAQSTYDIWAYGVVVYEAIAGVPLSPYACRGKRSMTGSEIGKIGMWDETSVKKALKHIPHNAAARDLIKGLLHYDPEQRFNSLRHVLDHPFFSNASISSEVVSKPLVPTTRSGITRSRQSAPAAPPSRKLIGEGEPPGVSKTESAESSVENRENGVSKSGRKSNATTGNSSSPKSIETSRSFGGLRKLQSRLRRQTAS